MITTRAPMRLIHRSSSASSDEGTEEAVTFDEGTEEAVTFDEGTEDAVTFDEGNKDAVMSAVSTYGRPRNKSASASAMPRDCLPAIGWPPINRPRRMRFPARATIADLVLPASVISVPG